MATVIRAAQMDPERVVLNPRASIAALRREAEPVAARGAATATPAGPSAAAATASAARSVESPRVPEWPTVLEPGTFAGGGASADKPGTPAPFDRDAERKSFLRDLDKEREAALADAREEGRREGKAEWDEGLAALGTLIASAHQVLDADIAGTEDVIVEIAYEAACRIVGEATARKEGALAVVREVMKTVREREELTVRVSPDDFEWLERHRAELLPGDSGAQIDLVSDERVALGGCLVETSGGTLDGRLETQLQRLAETLADARRQGELK